MPLQPQYDNLLTSSFLLYLNNKLASKQAFYNYTGVFYPISNTIQGYYTYSLPFSQILSDSSVSGSLIPTGVFSGKSFIGTGTSGFIGINYEKAQIYWNKPVQYNNISGAFSIKQINISLLSQPQTNLLFETKTNLRPKFPNPTLVSGLSNDSLTFPTLFLTCTSSSNSDFALGGLDETKNTYGGYLLCSSQFELDAVNSILRDLRNTYFAIFDVNGFPYNALGGLKNDIFNYTGIAGGYLSSGKAAFLNSVDITYYKRELYNDVLNLNSEVYFSVVDFEVTKTRYPRQ